MRCRDFHSMLGDWSRGRLDTDGDALMNQHISECRACSQEAEIDGSLRRDFNAALSISQTPDLWERIEARVETTSQQRFGFLFRFQRAFALSGAMVAGAFLAFVMLRGPIEPIRNILPDGEAVALDKIIEIRDPEPVANYAETPFTGDAARMLLVSAP